MKRILVRADIPKEPAMTIEGQLIVSPGIYYGISLTKEKIIEHIKLTDWADKFNTALIYGHKTNTKDKWVGNASPDDWAGHFSPPEYLSLSDGVDVEGAYSNIYIYDEDLARKLAYGKLKCGVSTTFDLRNGGIKNLSVIDNPMCKQAFLNLSDSGRDLEDVEIISPNYLNLTDLPTTERRTNSQNTMTDKINEKTEKEIELEKKIVELEKQLAEKPSEPVVPVVEEAKVETAPTEEPKTPAEPKTPKEPKTPVEPVTPVVEPVTPTVEPAKEDPVVITEESDAKDDSKVVDAIKDMSEKVTAELKKAATPQTVAPTSQDPSPSRDDEVTQSLVDKYKSLHDLE